MQHPLTVPLQAAGLRLTFSRLEVLTQFCLAGETPCTSIEVYAGLNQRGVSMAYSTVFRMLQVLSYAGLLLPAGTRGRHPCYRPSPAVLSAWQDLAPFQSPVVFHGSPSGPTPESA
jgi:Fe2+ or Zn2+ uptake regulation protein